MDGPPFATEVPGEGRAGRVVHLLHLRKTGGTALWHAIEPHARTDRYAIVHHPHVTLLRDVPLGEHAIFFLRDPLTRFVSGFYSRQRKGRPRFDRTWTPGERETFERFRSPNELASTLSSPDEAERELARRAIGAVPPLRSMLTWLESETYLFSRLPDIFYIGFQETLNEDFDRLKLKLGLPADLRLSDDEVIAHRNPAYLDYHLDDVAVANLRARYEADLRLLDFCRAHAAEVNGRPASVQGA
jgi:hypothetical protein